MSPTAAGLLGLAGLFVLLALRMPVGIAMMLIGVLGFGAPLAVAMAAARPGRPVFRFPAGSVSVTPRVSRQAMSPVATSTAVNWPHGGF